MPPYYPINHVYMAKRKYTKRKSNKKKKSTPKPAPKPLKPQRRQKWCVDVVVDDKTYIVARYLTGFAKSDKISIEELKLVYAGLLQQYGMKPISFDEFMTYEVLNK